jgi:hypothetical protein
MSGKRSHRRTFFSLEHRGVLKSSSSWNTPFVVSGSQCRNINAWIWRRELRKPSGRRELDDILSVSDEVGVDFAGSGRDIWFTVVDGSWESKGVLPGQFEAGERYVVFVEGRARMETTV